MGKTRLHYALDYTKLHARTSFGRFTFRGRSTCFLACLGGLIAALAAAPTLAEEPVSEDWQYSVVPYLWALSLKGDVTARGEKSAVDVGFDKILENLNFAVMLLGDARKGRWGVFGDVLYAKLEDDEKDRFLKTNVDLEMAIVSFSAYHRLGAWALGSGANDTRPKLTTDLYVGGRYTDLDVNLKLKGRLDRSKKADAGENWLDPIVGVRTFWQLSPKWIVSVFGDIGGFGVGSDFQWQATGQIGYHFKLAHTYDSWVQAGYRALHQDYSKGSGSDKFEWDVTLHGPGLAWRINF